MLSILTRKRKKIWWITRILVCAVFVLAMAVQYETILAETLTIERIASLPSLTGTAPTNPVWSPNSTQLAFLWNDKAIPFRNIWIVSAIAKKPKQITDMASVFPYPRKKATNPYNALVQKAVGRARGGISEVIWTPNGKALVFSYQGDIFRVNADGTNLKRLTQTKGRKYNLGFSFDGKFLSYLQEGDLWRWNQETQQLIQATRNAAPPIGIVSGARHTRLDTEFTSYKWSPDGRSIALYFEDRRNVRKVLFPDYLGEETTYNLLRRDYPGDNDFVRAIGIYSLDKGSLRMIELKEKTDRRISNYNWSLDGRKLLIDQNSENSAHRWIYVVKLEDGSIEKVWHDCRKTRIAALWTSEWQTEGQGILFVSDKDGFNHLYSFDLEKHTVKQLTKGNWSIIGMRGGGASLTVSSNTKEVYFISTKKNPYERHVYKMPETGGTITQLTSFPGCHLPFISPDGLKIALLHSNDVTPTELYVVDTRKGSLEHRITHSPPQEFYNYKWIQPRYVSFKSHIDGVTLHGRILEPPNLDKSKKYPVILGPVYSNTVRNNWSGRYGTLQQYLALEGQYIGFHVDIRGSSGYGHVFRDKFQFQAGGIDIEDLHSGVQYLKTLPYVDPERIGIWGSSYGGLLTTMSLLKKPGVYKAGVAGAPATNVWHAMTSEVRLLGKPDTHPEIFRKGSTFCYGKDLQDHLMIIHGMQDSVVQFKDSAALAEKLMLLGKDFDFVVAPSANHSWTSKDYVAVYLLKKLVGHFDRYLGRGPR